MHGHALQGKKVVFTGFRDKNLETQIKSLGGIIVSSISNQTDILVYDDENAKYSTKRQKAINLGKDIVSKKDFITKYINQQTKQNTGWWGMFFGTKNTLKKTSESNIIVPDYDVESKINKTTSYCIHDNGGRPFKVVLTKDEFSVYKSSNVDSLASPYNVVVIKPKKYKRVFVGKCPVHGSKFDGNSILVNVAGKSYIYIGSSIYSFTTKDNIVGYKSPIIGSDVAYPYAYGEVNTYLLLKNTYIPNNILTQKDPYDQYYGHHLKLSIRKQQEWQKKYFAKYRMTIKILHKR